MYTVVSLVREPADVLARFLRFYLSGDAERLLLFVDGPAPDGLPSDPRLEVQVCDEAFWLALVPGGRTSDLIAMQEAVFGEALRRCETPWMLVVDADEFVCGDRPASEGLAAVPDGVDAVTLRVAEAVWGPGDDLALPYGSSYFRRPLGRLAARAAMPALYGRLAPLFRRGLLGHVDGKSFVRRGGDFDVVGCHHPRRAGRPVGGWAEGAMAAFRVAHYDAIGFERWQAKWRRRVSGLAEVPDASLQRRRLTTSIAAEIEAGETRARRLFAELFSLDRGQTAVLRTIRGLEDPAGSEALLALREPPAG
jgi:hypothetical protein